MIPIEMKVIFTQYLIKLLTGSNRLRMRRVGKNLDLRFSHTSDSMVTYHRSLRSQILNLKSHLSF